MAAKATKASTPAPSPEAAEEPVSRGGAAKKAVRSRPAPAEPPPAAADEAVAEEEEFVPMNRAERRAKGRGKSTAQVPGGRGKVSGSHGPAHTQRNWASRRTG